MSEIQLDSDQANAVSKVHEWMKGHYTPRNGNNKIFVLTGWAGTGKSFLVSHMLDTILKGKRVSFVTFTGKAALVLRTKNVPAITLHRLMYFVDEKNVKGKRKLVFKKRPELYEASEIIIIDEISMVGDKLIQDLLSFGVMILAIGDGGQLGPVKALDNGLAEKPDAELTKVHRNALKSPIIKLATAVRLGHKIEPIGNMIGPSGKAEAWVGYPNQLSVENLRKTMLKADQILVAKHKTRMMINNMVKRLLGFDMNYPLPQRDEKIICKRNNWDELLINLEVKKIKDSEIYELFSSNKQPKYNLTDGYSKDEVINAEFLYTPLINGMVGYAMDHVVLGEPTKQQLQKKVNGKFVNVATRHFKLDFKPDFVDFPFEYYDNLLLNVPFYNEKDHEEPSVLHDLYEYFEVDGSNEILEMIHFFQTAYAITVHSSQGSQFKNVLLFNERMTNDDELHKRWLYTGITRASHKLILMLNTKGLNNV